jgi:hypothetical protein
VKWCCFCCLSGNNQGQGGKHLCSSGWLAGWPFWLAMEVVWSVELFMAVGTQLVGMYLVVCMSRTGSWSCGTALSLMELFLTVCKSTAR